MIKPAMRAIIKKDFRGMIANRRLFFSLLIVPLLLTIVLPSIFILSIHFTPDDPDIIKLLELIPPSAAFGSLELMVSWLILNYILPVFFLMIPIMTASIMAASAFVGEKERNTLETLLYCPLTLREIFRAKVLASFLLSMFVSLISFAAMFLVFEIELYLLMGYPLFPGINWIIIIFLIAPSISLIAVTLIVRGSSKAQSIEESQQSAIFLIIPVILLVIGQFSGIVLMSIWILLGLGILCALLAWIFLNFSMKHFTYEEILKKG